VKSGSHNLHLFEPISLEEMDSVKLQDRTDTKFVFHADQLNNILERISPGYRILELNGKRASPYETLYFDTPAMDLFHSHHRGKLNRYKVRFRKYVDSDLTFFEVKFKSNRGRTVKRRITSQAIHTEISGKEADFLREISPLDPNSLIPVVWVYYNRATLVGKHSPERLTLDFNLAYRFNGKDINYSELIIAESKQDRSARSPFIRHMKELHIRQGSISKYCLGIMGLYDFVKRNNFKPKIRKINKVIYGKSA
jgi:hypothetical protein